MVTCAVLAAIVVWLKPAGLSNHYLVAGLSVAFGGLLVGVASEYLEHHLVAIAVAAGICLMVAAIVTWLGWSDWSTKPFVWPMRILMILFPIALGVYLYHQKRDDDRLYQMSVRNFYAVLRVREMTGDSEPDTLRLINGTISHGTQLLDPTRRRTPTAYYGPKSGMGRAIRYFQDKGVTRVGVVGLGAGVTAAYCRPGDYFRFYEINPLGLAVAMTKFSFLRDCPADHEVLLGDARLTMENQPSQQFDVLAIDAFSSDAIPVHLLTREAMVLYFRHLKPAGILAVHVSNRYLDLIPVVTRHARDLGKIAIDVDDDVDDANDGFLSSSDWVLVSGDRTWPAHKLFQDAGIATAKVRSNLRPWTDDYSNLFQILK
jgi:hypothetical protein